MIRVDGRGEHDIFFSGMQKLGAVGHSDRVQERIQIATASTVRCPLFVSIEKRFITVESSTTAVAIVDVIHLLNTTARGLRPSRHCMVSGVSANNAEVCKLGKDQGDRDKSGADKAQIMSIHEDEHESPNYA